MDHGNVNPRLTRFLRPLVILAQSAIPAQPSKCPLDGLIANDKFCLTRLLRMAPKTRPSR